jgi:peptide/nickel transport system permease protein
MNLVQPLEPTRTIDRRERRASASLSSSWAVQVWSRFRHHPYGRIGLGVFVVLVMLALTAPWLVPYDPDRASLADRAQPPSLSHLLGTDTAGRDVLARLLVGIRVSLLVGLATAICTSAIGLILGGIAGSAKGWIDGAITRFTDVVACFPTFVALLILATLVRPSILNLVVIFSLFGWEGKCRLVRGEVLSLREQPFIEAARCLGMSPSAVLRRHLLPNALTPVLVAAPYTVGGAILSEAGLSFLGLGIPLPTASLGNMLSLGTNLTAMLERPWLWLPPGLTIILIVLAINFVGDGLRDSINPRGTR